MKNLRAFFRGEEGEIMAGHVVSGDLKSFHTVAKCTLFALKR